jgi:plasmid maintenance system killer protein
VGICRRHREAEARHDRVREHSERPRVAPGNRLEPLRGDLKGFYSIRVNDQWRIVFEWTQDDPGAVDVVDYH